MNAQQLEQFEKDGYLIIKNFFSPFELRNQASKLLNEFDFNSHPKVKFTTSDSNHIGDEYFLNSGDKIRYFLEEEADLNDSNLDKSRIVNKIGHAIHELDPLFSNFSKSEKVVDLAKSLGYEDPRILQSMLIFKQPFIGSEVGGHVDSTFLYTKPSSATGLWFALEDCTLTNGCMWFVPGSHKKYELHKRFVRNEEGTGTKMLHFENGGIQKEPNPEDYVATPVNAGDLVLIHGKVYHKSGANRSLKSRWIYTFHLIEGSFEYPPNNWLLPTEKMPFTKLFK